jgi:ubiquinone/menaquinone biosynthesis C-methylase UbiE
MSDRRFSATLAEKLDRPERLTWLPPTEVLRALDLRAGETIADIGAGTGYFTLPLAVSVGNRGKVYAVDSQQGMLEILRKKIDATAWENVEIVHAEADVTYLSSASCDLALFANVWHEFADRTAVLREAMRILKKSGRIAILDWRPDVEPEHWPPLGHRLSANSALMELLAGGFKAPSLINIGKYSWLVQGTAS